jgi:hypothetical protein
MGAIVEQTTPSGYPANDIKRRTTTNAFFPSFSPFLLPAVPPSSLLSTFGRLIDLLQSVGQLAKPWTQFDTVDPPMAAAPGCHTL